MQEKGMKKSYARIWEFVKDFLRRTKFADGCKFDNDHGMIVEYNNLFTADGFFDCYSWSLEQLLNEGND